MARLLWVAANWRSAASMRVATARPAASSCGANSLEPPDRRDNAAVVWFVCQLSCSIKLAPLESMGLTRPAIYRLIGILQERVGGGEGFGRADVQPLAGHGPRAHGLLRVQPLNQPARLIG